MQYIDKSAIVAEIEKIMGQQQEVCKNDVANGEDPKIENISVIYHLQQLLKIIDTLKVKEVDLDKEIDKWWCSLYTDYSMKRVSNHKFIPEPAYIDSNFKQSEIGKTKIAFELWMDWKVDSDDIEWDADTIRNFAKHFFELGLKAQKGE